MSPDSGMAYGSLHQLPPRLQPDVDCTIHSGPSFLPRLGRYPDKSREKHIPTGTHRH